MKLRVLILLLFMLGLSVIPAAAHEGREVGEYSLVFGWRVEPAYSTLLNGPEITITRHGGDEHAEEAEHSEEEATPEAEHSEGEADHHDEESAAVSGLAETLQIEVSFGPDTRVLNLREVHGEPGNYTADLIPMMPGDYTFRLFGTIEGVEVDETFSAADGQFSSVNPIEDIQFP
jgi:hypothetical protein